VWRVDPDLADAAIVEAGDGAAYIHMPLTLTIGLKAKPDVIHFLVSILCVKQAERWRVAALFTTTEKTKRTCSGAAHPAVETLQSVRPNRLTLRNGLLARRRV
jgi:hypothetical protein